MLISYNFPLKTLEKQCDMIYYTVTKTITNVYQDSLLVRQESCYGFNERYR